MLQASSKILLLETKQIEFCPQNSISMDHVIK